MAARKFTCTLPDGRVAKRSSKSMAYQYCVAVYFTPWNAEEPRWGLYRWSQNLVNATKAGAALERKVATYKIVKVLPTNEWQQYVDESEHEGTPWTEDDFVLYLDNGGADNLH